MRSSPRINIQKVKREHRFDKLLIVLKCRGECRNTVLSTLNSRPCIFCGVLEQVESCSNKKCCQMFPKRISLQFIKIQSLQNCETSRNLNCFIHTDQHRCDGMSQNILQKYLLENYLMDKHDWKQYLPTNYMCVCVVKRAVKFKSIIRTLLITIQQIQWII